MKNLYKSISIIALLFMSSQLVAQTNEINYTLQGNITSISNQQVNITVTLIKSGETLVLNQIAGNKTRSTTFNILGNDQNWAIETSLGIISYALDADDSPGEFVLTGLSSGISALLTINESDTEQQNYTFHIDTISYQ